MASRPWLLAPRPSPLAVPRLFVFSSMHRCLSEPPWAIARGCRAVQQNLGFSMVFLVFLENSAVYLGFYKHFGSFAGAAMRLPIGISKFSGRRATPSPVLKKTSA